MSESIQRNVLCMAHIEASYGVAPTFTPASDGVLLYREATPVGFEMSVEDLNPIRASFTPTTSPVGNLTRLFNPVILAQGSGTAGTAPKFSPLLRACALAETVSAGTSVTYRPRSSAFESTSVKLGFGVVGTGVLYDITGIYSNLIISGQVGQGCPMEFAGRGIWSAPANIASEFSGLVVPANSAQSLKSADLSIGNGTVTWDKNTATNPLVFLSFRFDRGISVEDDSDANSADGIIRTGISPGTPTLQLVLEAKNTLTSLINFETDANAGTLHNISFTIGQTAGKKVQINGPQAQITNVQVANEGNRRRQYTVDYKLTHVTDDQEFSIVLL